MSSNLEVKEVDFNGATLMATQLKEDDKIYVGVRWVCEGIGLTEKQRDRQVSNVQSDIVLSRGVKNLSLKFGGQVRNVIAIELDFLPLWLAKISITPKMQKENPFVVKNLVEYQLKAKDVLAQAFVKDNGLSNELQFMQGILDQMKRNELEQKQLKDNVENIKSYLVDSPDFKDVEREINKYARVNGMRQNDVRTMVYQKIEDMYGISVMQRAKNERKKLQEERVESGKKPYADSTLAQKVTGMDIIRKEKLEKSMLEILSGL